MYADSRASLYPFVSLMDMVERSDDAELAITDVFPDDLGVDLLGTIVPGYLRCIGKIA